jgi:hypothetical protein
MISTANADVCLLSVSAATPDLRTAYRRSFKNQTHEGFKVLDVFLIRFLTLCSKA